MSRFMITLRESLEVFSENPKLILPKLLVSFLYSIVFVLVAGLIVNLFKDPESASLVGTIALFALEVVFVLVDIFVNLMFPHMVKQHRDKKKVSLRKSFRYVLSNLSAALPVLLIYLALIVLSLIWMGLFLILFYNGKPLEETLLSFAAPIIALAAFIAFFFYLIFPIATLEKPRLLDSLKRSARLSISNWHDVAKALILSTVLSLASLALAFAVNIVPPESSAVFWAVFVVVRFLTAYINTYLYVLSPVFYFNYAKASPPKGK